MRTVFALAFSAALLALGIPRFRERIAFELRIFAICRVGWAVQFHHEPLAIINITDRANYEKFCGRCHVTLSSGPIPADEQAVIDRMLELVDTALDPLDMGLPVIEQRGFMN